MLLRVVTPASFTNFSLNPWGSETGKTRKHSLSCSQDITLLIILSRVELSFSTVVSAVGSRHVRFGLRTLALSADCKRTLSLWIRTTSRNRACYQVRRTRYAQHSTQPLVIFRFRSFCLRTEYEQASTFLPRRQCHFTGAVTSPKYKPRSKLTHWPVTTDGIPINASALTS